MSLRLAASFLRSSGSPFRCFRLGYIKHYSQATSIPKSPRLSELLTEGDNNIASAWIDEFRAVNKIPKELVEFSFSRSSGPGGQNVNKVNTKATLRCSLNNSWMPVWALPVLMKNSHYVASTHSILLTSTVHRSQAQNIDHCLDKLHSLISSAASSCIKVGPTEAQKKKVEGLIRVDKARRKMEKMSRSSVKQGRRSGGRGHDF